MLCVGGGAILVLVLVVTLEVVVDPLRDVDDGVSPCKRITPMINCAIHQLISQIAPPGHVSS